MNHNDSMRSVTPPIAIRRQSSQSQLPPPDDEPPLDLVAGVAERLADKLSQKKLRVSALRKQASIGAMSTQIGFRPVLDDDGRIGRPREESAVSSRSPSVVRKDFNLGSLSGSGTRSSSPQPGLSTLTQQLEGHVSKRPPLSRSCSKLVSETGSASASSPTESEAELEDSVVYEVPLEHDFISTEVDVEPRLAPTLVRKMTAHDFTPLCCLGKGTFGTVFLVKQVATGKLYAQKQFRKASLTVRKRLVEQTKTERAILESVNRHPFVVKLFYAFQDHEKLYLILEYAQGGELFERMRNEHMFPEETAAFYMAEMVLALEHLHSTVGVVYRDLKPENCLLDAEGHLLLTDFGLSKVAAEGEACRSMTGTVEYMAPEVIQQQQYGTAVDWWSFGILAVDLLTGSTPFQAHNDMKIREKILKAKLSLPYYLGPDAKDLITRLLRKEPKKRLGANMPKDMATIKGHRFFRRIDWKKLERRELEPPIRPLITNPELAENFATEFTSLSLSPETHPPEDKADTDPFGGFSYVGSRSLLEQGLGCF